MKPLVPGADDGAFAPAGRQPYQPPRLVPLGDLRDLTLGASPGVGDSGSATTFKCPGCP
jgi:hypothetical protein